MSQNNEKWPFKLLPKSEGKKTCSRNYKCFKYTNMLCVSGDGIFKSVVFFPVD